MSRYFCGKGASEEKPLTGLSPLATITPATSTVDSSNEEKVALKLYCDFRESDEGCAG